MVEPTTAEPPSPSVHRAPRSTRVRASEQAPASAELPVDFRPPHPLRTAAALLAPASLPAALWWSGVLPAAPALGLALPVVVFALVQSGLSGYDLHRSRRLGEALLHSHPGLPPIPGLAAWRAAELTSARNRRSLARLVRQLRRECETCMSLGSPRLDRAVLDVSLPLLRRLESRLEPAAEPVSPLGMLYVQELVTGELGPLSAPDRAGGLLPALQRALAELERR